MRTENHILIDGTDLYYKIYGKGMPMLILHGWGVEHHIWANPLESILKNKKSKYQRIYIDLPGMGRSIASPDIHNSDDMIDVIGKFIDAVIPNKQFLLAGQSYGGYLARGLLLRRKEQIAGLFLMCPLLFPGYRKGTVPPLTVLEKDEAFLESLSENDRNSFTYLSIVLNKQTWKDYKKDIRMSIRTENEGFLAGRLDGAFTDDINKEPYIFERPTLILVGRQDTEVGFEDQMTMFKKFPRATIAVLDKCGHNLQIEQKSLFKAAIHEWLNRVESYRD